MSSEMERPAVLNGTSTLEMALERPRRDDPLHVRFELQAEATPERIAVIHPGPPRTELTYAELNARANRLAHHLAAFGVAPEERVAIHLDRGTNLVVAVLAILKAGGAYVPIDLSYPRERIAAMLDDARPRVILGDSRLRESLPPTTARVLAIDRCASLWEARPSTNLERPSSPEQLAYVISTSGTTGRPKGVLVEHRNVTRLFDATAAWFGFGGDDTWTMFHSIAFDFSVWELFGALLHGGRLVVVPERTRYSPAALLRLLADERVTVLNQTPSAFRQLVEVQERLSEPPKLDLRTVVLGGELLELPSLAPWFARHGDERPRIVNMYGITETTVHVTYRPIRARDLQDAPKGIIGRPLPDLEVYVLDADRKPVPPGATGEIYVGGAGLARGYLDQPELTRKSFVPHPFSPHHRDRLYRTGDAGRVLPNGELQHLGRLDRQVKIRGFRIELDEIQIRLNACPDVRESFVMLREDEPGEKRIVAYVVPREDGETDPGSLAEFLGRHLPDPMIPSVFVGLSALPLNENGKPDTRRLPPPRSAPRPDHPSSSTAMERTVAGAYREALGIDRVGLDENFFEIGGDSLRVGTVVAELEKRLGRELDPMRLFERPTIRSLARSLVAEPSATASAGRRAVPRADETRTEPPTTGPRPRSASRSRDRSRSAPWNDSIAIVGMAGRFPGAPDVEAFWQGLLDGRDSIRRFSPEELEAAGLSPDQTRSPDYVAARGVVDGAEIFDARFFGYTPAEARLLDPQQRIWLEVAWAALENAGLDPTRFPGSVGVFAGCSASTYLWQALRGGVELPLGNDDRFQTIIANDKDFIATRTSYKLDLRGPSVGVQTACSTSLVAVAMACQSLADLDADACIAGGSTVSFPQIGGYRYREGAMLSRDGHCRPFDAQAAGTVFGDGVAAVVLKRLADAIEDGDAISAVIRGAAVNNDGRNKVSFTAPSVDGQAEAISSALRIAGVDPRDVEYVEAHGTATPLGDPIEVLALSKSFGASTQERGYCGLGSVKSNVGHLDAASGVAGLIKTALSLEREEIPPTIHFERPNPGLRLETSPFYVVRERTPWKRNGKVRLASVSSLGVGGTNAHVVLEEPPPREPPAESRERQLILLSAKSTTALDAASDALAEHLERHPGVDLADVAFTLQTGRQAFSVRQSLVCSKPEEASRLLRQRPRKQVLRGESPEQAARVVFLFPGQGSQHVDMARGLYEREKPFRDRVDRLSELLEEDLGLDIRKLMFPAEDERDEASDLLTRTGFAQPALFVIEYALARLWMDWGVRPASLAGHSLGEYVAACLAGVFRVEDALTLIARRARIMNDLPGGAMRAVRLSETELAGLLPSGVELAAVNAPRVSIVSGPTEAILELDARLAAEGESSVPLSSSHGFHSSMMEPALAAVESAVASIELRPPRIPFISGLTGDWITDAEATDPAYWAQQLRRPIRFSDGARALLREPGGFFLEVGPGNTLASCVLQHRGDHAGVRASLAPGDDALESVLKAAGRLWLAGVEVDWTSFYALERRRKCALPTYRFEGERFSLDAPFARETRPAPERLGAEARDVDPRVATTEPAEPPEPGTAVTAVRELISDLLGESIAGRPDETRFTELGFDSLFLTRASAEIDKRFGVRIPFRRMLEELDTIETLAAHLEAEGVCAKAPTDGAGPTPPGRSASGRSPAEPKAGLPHRRAAATGNAFAGELQRKHLESLAKRFSAKTAGSKRAAEASRPYLADPRSVSGFRRAWKELVYPILVEKSSGCRLRDVDGNEYVDLTMGFGVNLFGHSPSFIQEAVGAQLELGLELGPQRPLAEAAARKISELTGMQRVAFTNTGSEAVLAALRVARTVTGKNKVVYFDGSYHGLFDEVLAHSQRVGGRLETVPAVAGVTPDAVENVLVLEYGAPESLDVIREHLDDLAAVLVEPVQSRNPDLRPVEFLRELRTITEPASTALIFDEMITGFRVHPGGMQAELDIRADLATYGKVIGGGLPLGVIAGRPRYMDALDGGVWRYGDDSEPESDLTFFAGTYVRHPLALAAANAVLDRLAAEGPGLQQDLNRRTDELVRELEHAFERAGAPIRVPHYSSWFRFLLPPESGLSNLFFHHLLDHGIHVWSPDQNLFLSTAHGAGDLEKILSAAEESARALGADGFFPSRPAASSRRLPLTAEQFEIWYASQLGPRASCAFNESFTLELRGELDSSAFRSALDEVVGRHDALRLRFLAGGEEQEVAPPEALEVAFQDWSDEPEDVRSRRLRELCEHEAETPFDLENGPLLRFHLLRAAPELHILVWTAHHLVVDGWSTGLLLEELGRAYTARARGELVELVEAPSFEEYAAWEQREEDGSRGRVAAEYWKRQLPETPPLLDLPTDRPRPPVRSFAGATARLEIEAPLLRKWKQAAARQRTTPFVLLLTAFQSLLFRLTGQTELTVGMLTAGQAISGMERLVGHCVKLLPIHSRPEAPMSFAAMLAATNDAVLDARSHDSCSYRRIIQNLELARSPGRSPLVEAIFNLDRKLELSFAELDATFSLNAKRAVSVDLFFNLSESDAGLTIDVDYNAEIFEEDTIQRWLGHYVTLLDAAVESPERALAELPLLSPAERDRLLRERSEADASPARPHTRGETVHGTFEDVARRDPERLAISAGDARWSYRDLDEAAESVAHRLHAHGISTGSVVALLLDRTPRMIAAMLGTLKAGAAYLPLDPEWPRERIRFILEDAGAAMVLLDASSSHRPEDVPALRVDEPGEPPAGSLPGAVDESSLAYVIYTSGSTGRPKGVEIPHSALVNLLRSMAKRPGCRSTDRLMAVTTVSFDIAALEIFLPLSVGATVVLADRSTSADGTRLLESLRASKATMLQATPSTWHLLLEAGWDGTPALEVLVGGEALPRDLRDALVARAGAVWNLYGPTETTVWSCCARLDDADEPIRIGLPIDDTEIYVVDRFGGLCPPGVPGELYIGGAGLARGYRNRPELTAERFVPNRFGEHRRGEASARLYRTGDIVRQRPDGELEYVGRADHQVKVRGFRVELGEIETVLGEHEAVGERVVVTREYRSSDRRLVAYFVPVPGRSVTSTELREHLRTKLPDYMVPQHFVELPSLPRLTNGKLDRRALPDVVRLQDDAEGDPPETPAEKMLAELWKEALGLEHVTVTDNFFTLGGHSLLAMEFLREIERRTGRRLTAMDLVFHTLGQIASSLGDAGDGGGPPEAETPDRSSTAPDTGRPEGLASRFLRAIKWRTA